MTSGGPLEWLAGLAAMLGMGWLMNLTRRISTMQEKIDNKADRSELKETEEAIGRTILLHINYISKDIKEIKDELKKLADKS